MPPVFNIAVYLYPHADILDFSGPVEIFSVNPPSPDVPRSFNITTFASESPLKAGNGELVYLPAKTLEEVEESLENYDILIVPGGPPDKIVEYFAKEPGTKALKLIERFAGLQPRGDVGQRVILSVCTGALLLGYAGILAGKTVTTHHVAYDMLKEICDKAAGGQSNTTVVKKRWVDAGKTNSGVQIFNAGGVSSGIDASLYVMEKLVGKEQADWSAEIAEFSRRGQDEAWGVKV